MNTIKMSLFAFTLSLMSFATITAITWKSESIDVGEIPQGKPKAIIFEFKNTSNKDVIITNVQGSCGCTATDYTKTPIKAGKSGSVTATYNAANIGAFTKTVSVTTNAEATPKVLTLKGTVKAVVVQG
jgi:Protein of unknown function (DUF1573)